MNEFVTELIQSYGYLAIFLLIFIENIFPPIPSEIILTFGGFMVSSNMMIFLKVVVVSTLASYLGALLLYGMGYAVGISNLDQFLQRKYIRLLKIKKENIDKAMNQFEKYGKMTVFLCRLVPVVRSLISIPAGMFQMNLFVFSIWSILGTLIWNSILVYFGMILGDNWNLIHFYIQQYSFVILVLFIVGSGYYFYHKRKRY